MSRKNARKTIEDKAMAIAQWVGTPTSLILHTLFFVLIFALKLIGVSIDKILLLLTTVVSLEAIYLSLFIQMTVNQHSESLEDVEENIDEIQEDVEEINENIDDVQEDVDTLEKNIPHGHIHNKLPDQSTVFDYEDHVSRTLQKIVSDLTNLSVDVKKLQDEVKAIK
jgi:hypothetical protein